VDSASATQIVLSDTQGQTFSLAITPQTMITQTAQGTAADLTVGTHVIASGMASGNGITAVTIAVQSAQ
jgi:hypothetical protein